MLNKLFFKKHNALLFVFFLLLTTLALREMILLSYLNDEWIQYGLVQIHGWTAELFKFSWLGIVLGPARPLGTIVNNLFFLHLPFQAWPFFVWALIFHSLNGVLCYALSYKLSKNRRIAMICSLFFVTSSVSYQTFSWLAATVQGVASTTFILLTVYLFLLFLESYKKRFLLYTVLSLYVAVLFKDSSVFVLLALPVLFVLFPTRPIAKKVIFSIIIPSVLVIVAFGVYRVALSMTGFEHRFVQLGTNAVLYPYLSLSHFFIPFRFMYRMAETFEKMMYPTIVNIMTNENVTLLAYTMVSDVLSILGSIIGTCIVLILYIKRSIDRKTILFAAIFYLLCFLPIAFYLDHRNASYVESRYLYLMNFPIGLLLGCALEFLFEKIKLYKKIVMRLCLIGLYTIVGIFFVKNIQVTQREITDSVRQGEAVTSAVKAMKKKWKTLPDKAIVYLEGDRFFYHPTLKVPFQLGPGFMMMVVYYDTGTIPKELIDSWFLLSVSEEGYREVSSQAFGYFYEISELQEFLSKNPHIATKQIVGMRFDSNTGEFIDITDRVIRDIVQ